jgi:hypothetical protein
MIQSDDRLHQARQQLEPVREVLVVLPEVLGRQGQGVRLLLREVLDRHGVPPEEEPVVLLLQQQGGLLGDLELDVQVAGEDVVDPGLVALRLVVDLLQVLVRDENLL